VTNAEGIVDRAPPLIRKILELIVTVELVRSLQTKKKINRREGEGWIWRELERSIIRYIKYQASFPRQNRSYKFFLPKGPGLPDGLFVCKKCRF
jgi:hypothetical protein